MFKFNEYIVAMAYVQTNGQPICQCIKYKNCVCLNKGL